MDTNERKTFKYKARTAQEMKDEMVQTSKEKINMGILIEGVQEIQGATYYRVVSPYSDVGFVNRRYSDFQWLCDTLLNSNPNLLIPLFPPKTVGKASTDIIVERVMQFEKILKFFFENDEIKEKLIFKQFLSGSELNKRLDYDCQITKENSAISTKFNIQDKFDEGDDDLYDSHSDLPRPY